MRQHPILKVTLLIVASPFLCHSFSPGMNRHRYPLDLAPTQNQKIPTASSSAFGAALPSSLLPEDDSEKQKPSLWRRVLGRLDTVQSAGYKDDDKVLAAGLFGKIKQIHNPITYFVLGILSGFKWDWCFKSPIYWFAIGFTIKWYRARYVFKIPVWDRQPNWNNIITNKEQEKDLKAFTCKNCGSTIFIAKTREFFFEGNTGIGGLGCFSCGAKGKDNFENDRERIIEDVGDMDDYFEYERPLDFVSRAERRKILKENAGDEDKANESLLGGAATGTAPDNVVDAVIEEEDDESPTMEDEDESPTIEKEELEPEDEPEEEEEDAPEATVAAPSEEAPFAKAPTPPLKKAKATPKPKSDSKSDFDGLDELDMDAW